MIKPSLVVLDGHTLNPGDLSWAPLAAIGELTVHARTAREETAARIATADFVFTNKVELTEDHFSQAPRLRYVGVLATGYNCVDIEAARRRGIAVANVPDYGTAAVAQMTMALLLELTNHVGEHARSVRAGRWQSAQDWCYWDRPLIELSGLTLGLVGAGRIGRAVAATARSMGMHVLAANLRSGSVTPNPDDPPRTSLEELLRRSDVVSLHCPLTPETRSLINAERLALMKPSAFLLNTARGALVDEQALASALETGRIAGAGLDVLTEEPPRQGSPLIGCKNCLITPHQSWAAKAARERLLALAASNLSAFLADNRLNRVA